MAESVTDNSASDISASSEEEWELSSSNDEHSNNVSDDETTDNDRPAVSNEVEVTEPDKYVYYIFL